MVAGRELSGNETIDLENCKYFLMMGRNVTESLHNGETLGWIDGVANGAKVVYVDPRFWSLQHPSPMNGCRFVP